ncbi:Hypothetical predicted protein, partial [Mytilus galloprovincialis]
QRSLLKYQLYKNKVTTGTNTDKVHATITLNVIFRYHSKPDSGIEPSGGYISCLT